MYDRIAVIYDDSPESTRALSAALPIARMFNATLEVIVMMARTPAYTAYAQAVIPEAGELLAEDRIASYGGLQERAMKSARDAGVEPEFHLFESDEHHDVITRLKDSKTALLILGLHHKGPVISRLWRSVYSFAEDAPCSVLGVH
ncbi:Universal stress protein family protein [Bryocella elongata]|uniref:Universal stress protein family protein n=1 Tax=Bryocella elongata TaxID=863522 RepID=A0A1H5VSY5_9BACT|nr:universal stress protein [Bryocella elongata]SEF90330.1 Universal stress protein family protein [Bryocella elongata]